MSLTLKGYDFDCQTALNDRKLATSASTVANQSSRVTIANPGGDNFQECRISLCGLVRAFLADSCVSFQIVNTRETACDRLHLCGSSTPCRRKISLDPVPDRPATYRVLPTLDPSVLQSTHCRSTHRRGLVLCYLLWSLIDHWNDR